MATNIAPVPPAPRKKISPLVWILIAIAGLFAFAVIAVTALGFFAYHKAKQSGFDVALLENKPELAFIKMAVAANPDAEIVSIDEKRGIVSVKDRKTGKVVTLNFEDLRKGRFSFQEGGHNVTVQTQGEGDQGSVAVSTEEGTAQFGGVVKLPSWLPAYSGAKMVGLSAASADSSGGGFGFSTPDTPEKIISFYEGEMKKAGFKVELSKHSAGAILSATSGARKVVMNILTEGNGSEVNGTYEEK
jgi:hypothetical protein